jgi:hypothetical protein
VENPKRQAWMYLVVGVAAVIAGPWFLLTDNGQGSLGLLDWAILGMGIVAVYRGVRGFLDLKRGSSAPARSAEPGPRKIARPDASAPAKQDPPEKD